MNELIEQYEKFVVPTYKRNPLVIVSGKGSRVRDSEGKEYLDFFPGWAVSGIGHCHPYVVEAVREQVGKLIHLPNNYYNELQGLLAWTIVERSFPGKVFFCNSGAEANEAALKLARRWGRENGRFEVVAMEQSFHGRTFGALTATGQVKYRDGFGPMLPGFVYVPFGDIGAAKGELGDKTCAIIVEPVQGEGGVNPATAEYLAALRELCDERGALLIFDEVQTGMGRTGRYFSFQIFDIVPDVMTLAKGIAGGVPMGAMVAAEKVADVLSPGTHASTFGGSPLACAAALAVFRAIDEENLLANVEEMGAYLKKSLLSLKERRGIIGDVRGIGLMLGVQVKERGAEIVSACMDKGLLLNCTAEVVIRFMPALTVTREEIDEALTIFEGVLKETEGKSII